MRYRILAAERAAYPVQILCRVVRVSMSAYHACASGKTYVLSSLRATLAAQAKET